MIKNRCIKGAKSILWYIQFISADCCHYIEASLLNFPVQISRYVFICQLSTAMGEEDGRLKETFLFSLQCMEVLFLKKSANGLK